MDKKLQCKICGSGNSFKRHLAHERMFGMPGEFEYIECCECGCIQASEIPENLDIYYPSTYYSLTEFKARSIPGAVLLYIRDRYLISRKGWIVGRILSKLKPNSVLKLIGDLRVKPSANILDVGCGRGDLLKSLQNVGFCFLSGVDPNISSDTLINNSIRIKKSELSKVEGSYDLIMFHHSLEHIPNQLEVMKSARELLAPGGSCLVRIPLAGSYAWRHYGLNWVQFDAPRHLYLHTLRSMEILADQAGLIISRVEFDSGSFQFWGSEALAKGGTLIDPETNEHSRVARELINQSNKNWSKKAVQLNLIGDGDQAAFILKIKEA